MVRNWKHHKLSPFWLIGTLILVAIAVAACGGASGTTSSMGISQAARSSTNASVASGSTTGKAASTSSQPGAASPPVTPQYLIKTLKVGMTVKDPSKVADDLQSWITTTDSRSTSTGTDYEQAGNNLYNISLTFSVQASMYSQVYRYLRDYTAKNGGTMTQFNESVQDQTGTYVDTQSRIKTLQVEQTRLQTLMSQAQALSDVLTIEQRLTDVEGQLESYETQLNTLNSEVTFYTISISLQPTDTTAAPAPTDNGWSIGQTFQGAFAASISLGKSLLTFVIWLLAFSIYIVPVLLLVWFVRRRRALSRVMAMPHPAEAPSPTPPPSDDL